MAREFTMGIRLNYLDNNFSRGMRSATQQSMGLSRGLHTAAGSADSLTSKLGGLAVALGGMAAGKKAFDWLITSNADMETYQNTLTVVMKSQEKAIETLAWANKFAASTPFEIPEIVEATTKLTTYGLNAQKTLGIVGDAAAVMGKPLNMAVEAIADAQTGELERLKEAFSITKDDIAKQALMMGANVIDKKGSITDMKGMNAALFALLEQRFKGGMDMQSKTFKGMTSNLKDFVGTVGRDLGKPLFEKSKKDLEALLGVIKNLQDSGAIDRFIGKVHQIGAVVGNEMAFSRKIVIGTFKAIWTVAKPIFQYLRANWESIKPFVQGVAIAVGVLSAAFTVMRTATLLATLGMNLLRMAMLTNPIGWIALGIGLLIGLFIKMNGGTDGAKKKIIELWEITKAFGLAVWKIIQPYAMAVKKYLIDTTQKAVTWFITNWPMMRDTAINVIKQIWAFIGPTITRIATDIYKAISAVVNWFITYWPGIKKAFELTWLGIKTFFVMWWAWMSPFFMAGLKILWSIIKNGFFLIWGVIGDVWNMITGIIQVAWGIISGIWGIGLALLVGDWRGAWDAMVNMLDNVFTGIGKFFTGLGGLFYDSGKFIINTLVDGITAMSEAPIKAIKNVMAKIREYLPFSDAKKGPLSELTYSGGAIMTTLSAGVDMKAGVLSDAVGGAFASSGTNIPANAVPAVSAPAARSGAISVASLIGELHVNTQPGDTATDIVNDVISQLYERSKEVMGVLSNADKGALVG